MDELRSELQNTNSLLKALALMAVARHYDDVDRENQAFRDISDKCVETAMKLLGVRVE